MAIEDTFLFTFSWFRTTQMKNCFRCGIEFKVGDIITKTRMISKNSQKTRNYHKSCWEVNLQ